MGAAYEYTLNLVYCYVSPIGQLGGHFRRLPFSEDKGWTRATVSGLSDEEESDEEEEEE